MLVTGATGCILFVGSFNVPIANSEAALAMLFTLGILGRDQSPKLAFAVSMFVAKQESDRNAPIYLIFFIGFYSIFSMVGSDFFSKVINSFCPIYLGNHLFMFNFKI